MEHNELLGKAVYKSSCYSAPEVMQIVGWPKNIDKLKRKVVFAKPVNILKPTVYSGDRFVDGGSGTIDISRLEPVTEAETSYWNGLTKFTVTMEKGEYSFKEQGIRQIGYFPWVLLEGEATYSYCEY